MQATARELSERISMPSNSLSRKNGTLATVAPLRIASVTGGTCAPGGTAGCTARYRSARARAEAAGVGAKAWGGEGKSEGKARAGGAPKGTRRASPKAKPER